MTPGCRALAGRQRRSLLVEVKCAGNHLQLEGLLVNILAAIWQGHEGIQATLSTAVTLPWHHGSTHAWLACEDLGRLTGLAYDCDMGGFVLHRQQVSQQPSGPAAKLHLMPLISYSHNLDSGSLT